MHQFFKECTGDWPTVEVLPVSKKKKKLEAQDAVIAKKKADYVAQLEDENATLKFTLVRRFLFDWLF